MNSCIKIPSFYAQDHSFESGLTAVAACCYQLVQSNKILLTLMELTFYPKPTHRKPPPPPPCNPTEVEYRGLTLREYFARSDKQEKLEKLGKGGGHSCEKEASSSDGQPQEERQQCSSIRQLPESRRERTFRNNTEMSKGYSILFPKNPKIPANLTKNKAAIDLIALPSCRRSEFRMKNSLSLLAKFRRPQHQSRKAEAATGHDSLLIISTQPMKRKLHNFKHVSAIFASQQPKAKSFVSHLPIELVSNKSISNRRECREKGELKGSFAVSLKGVVHR